MNRQYISGLEPRRPVTKLELTGDLVRMSDDRHVKKIFLGKPNGKRKTGRPKLRWLNCLENDVKSMGVQRWRKKAEDRFVWAVILKEALAKLEGPYFSED